MNNFIASVQEVWRYLSLAVYCELKISIVRIVAESPGSVLSTCVVRLPTRTGDEPKSVPCACKIVVVTANFIEFDSIWYHFLQLAIKICCFCGMMCVWKYVAVFV